MRHDSDQRGSVLVESAIALSTFLILLFGIIEAGRMVYTYNTLAFAAREGTRYAVVRGANYPSPATAATIQTYVRGRAVGLDPTLMTVTTTWSGPASPNNTPGNFVQVRIDYPFTMVTTLFLNHSVTLSSTSRTVVLN